MGSEAVMDRTDQLLQGKGPAAVARTLDPFLVKVATYAEVQAQAWPPSASTGPATVYYLLTDEGDPDAVRDIISGSRTMRSLRVGVELVVHLGGAIDIASAHYRAKAALLESTWEKVVAVLQHPSNLRRTETYWYRAEDFDHPKPEAQGDRLTLKGRFTAVYDSDVGAF